MNNWATVNKSVFFSTNEHALLQNADFILTSSITYHKILLMKLGRYDKYIL